MIGVAIVALAALLTVLVILGVRHNHDDADRNRP
jgi:hypothetical protein